MKPHALLAALAIAAAACSNPVDRTPNKLPATAAGADNGAPADGEDASAAGADAGAPADSEDASGATCACLKAGMWYRYTELVLEALDGNPQHLAIGQLNTLWKRDIDKLELNFYVEVQKVQADRVELRLVNGARVAGTTDQTCLLPSTAQTVIHPRKGCALLGSEKAGMNIYAGTDKNPKNCAPTLAVRDSIPVRGATLSARVSDDCGLLLDGRAVGGGLARSALPKICTCLTLGDTKTEETCVPDPGYKDSDGACDGCPGYNNLADLLEAMSASSGGLKYQCDADGEEGACIDARFRAERIHEVPPPCP